MNNMNHPRHIICYVLSDTKQYHTSNITTLYQRIVHWKNNGISGGSTISTVGAGDSSGLQRGRSPEKFCQPYVQNAVFNTSL